MMRRKVERGRKVVGTLRSLMNAKNLQVECAKMVHESLLFMFYSMGVRQWY